MSDVRRILVPVDFSEHSKHAVAYACELAMDSKPAVSQLRLIHVIAKHGSSNGQADAIRSRLERLGDSVEPSAELAIDTIKEVIPGEPATVITKYARDNAIDLIVMGTHGRTGLSHLALGSVAERVIRSSDCPVLVMGPRGRARRVTFEQAAEAIAQQRGDQFEAGRDEGVELMLNLVRDRFQLHSDSSMRLVDGLMKNGWVSWSDGDPGAWHVGQGVEFQEIADVSPADKAESQAVDLIRRARQLRATDVHLDPTREDETVVRFRVDGKLEEYCRLNQAVGEHLINQLKTSAELDIADPFRPQEGRIRLPESLSDLEVRITTARVAAGDAIALRLFDGKNIFMPLDGLGLSEVSLGAVREMLHSGEGLVLVTGPTGSGKTTTVYSMLQNLGGVAQNVVSVEDPVEFAVPFVRQMNVDPKHGITMTSGLRTILRMDPDVVFLGEIRDSDAAQITMKAASSGKYVLSTFHTRDVASTITALRDVGIRDHSTAGNLTGIVNQRLVRRLCGNCKRAILPADQQRERFVALGLAVPTEVYEPVGCENCRDTGYRGRVGVFEVARIDERLANAVSDGESEARLKELLRAEGVMSLAADALTKAAEGITSVEEALAVHWMA